MGNTEIVLDLPMPPSVNRMWRRGKRGMYINPTVIAWQKQADLAVMASGFRYKQRPVINGPFCATMHFKRTRKGSDIDNKIKALLDFLQSREFIRNDSDCQRLTAQWVDGDPPCRVALKSIA